MPLRSYEEPVCVESRLTGRNSRYAGTMFICAMLACERSSWRRFAYKGCADVFEPLWRVQRDTESPATGKRSGNLPGGAADHARQNFVVGDSIRHGGFDAAWFPL